MLIYNNCFKIDLVKSYNNIYLVLGNGIIVDTVTNTAYTVFDPKILKVFNRVSYIYYNVSTKLFETNAIEHNIDTIEELYPDLCPIIKVTIDASDVVSYQYYVLNGVTNVSNVSIIPSINITTKMEVLMIYSNTITTSEIVLGITGIYIHDYGDLDLSDIHAITSVDNTIALADSTLGGSYATVTYLYQRVII